MFLDVLATASSSIDTRLAQRMLICLLLASLVGIASSTSSRTAEVPKGVTVSWYDVGCLTGLRGWRPMDGELHSIRVLWRRRNCRQRSKSDRLVLTGAEVLNHCLERFQFIPQSIQTIIIVSTNLRIRSIQFGERRYGCTRSDVWRAVLHVQLHTEWWGYCHVSDQEWASNFLA